VQANGEILTYMFVVSFFSELGLSCESVVMRLDHLIR
jgi:hypothetical protein